MWPKQLEHFRTQLSNPVLQHFSFKICVKEINIKLSAAGKIFLSKRLQQLQLCFGRSSVLILKMMREMLNRSDPRKEMISLILCFVFDFFNICYCLKLQRKVVSFCCFSLVHPSLQASLRSFPCLQPVLARRSTCPLSYPSAPSSSSSSPSSSSPLPAGNLCSAQAHLADPPWALWVGWVAQPDRYTNISPQFCFLSLMILRWIQGTWNIREGHYVTNLA